MRGEKDTQSKNASRDISLYRTSPRTSTAIVSTSSVVTVVERDGGTASGRALLHLEGRLVPSETIDDTRIPDIVDPKRISVRKEWYHARRWPEPSS